MLYIALIVIGLLVLDEVRSRRMRRASLLRRTVRDPRALLVGGVVFTLIAVVNLVVGTSPWSLVVAALAGGLVAVLVSGSSAARSENERVDDAR